MRIYKYADEIIRIFAYSHKFVINKDENYRKIEMAYE